MRNNGKFKQVIAAGSRNLLPSGGVRVSPNKIGIFGGAARNKPAPTFHQFKIEKGEAKVFNAGWKAVKEGYTQVVAEPAIHGDNTFITEAITKTRKRKGPKSKAKKRVDSLAARPNESCIVIVGGLDVPTALLVHVDAPVKGVKKTDLVNIYDLQTGRAVDKETNNGVNALETVVNSDYFMQFDNGKNTANKSLLVVDAKPPETKQTIVSAVYKNTARRTR